MVLVCLPFRTVSMALAPCFGVFACPTPLLTLSPPTCVQFLDAHDVETMPDPNVMVNPGVLPNPYIGALVRVSGGGRREA